MSQLVKPEKFFADRFGMTDRSLERVFAELVGGQVDHADLYFEYTVSEELSLEEGQVKRASRHVSQGAGVRAQAGERTGYAHTDQITLDRLALAASRAKYIADRGGSSAVVRVDSEGRPHDLYGLSKAPVDAPRDRKVALLHDVDRLAREYDRRITQVMATLWAEEQIILVATPRGWQGGDVRPLTRLSVSEIDEEGENRQSGNFGGGGRVEFDFFLEKE
ncbi:MAG: metalloprotease TldD, partial [Candidatus Rokubacteria bacterium]|nr:metalloprotease TldD [Candidatus Rokubacteria bacterium]